MKVNRPLLAAGIAVLAFAFLVIRQGDADHGWTGFLLFGEKSPFPRAERMPDDLAPAKPASYGYDGQFYAQLALDPALREPDELREALDVPAYRARRILLPGVAWALGMGQPSRIIHIFALLNVAAWFIWVTWLWNTLQPTDAAGWARWFACAFSLGVLDSVRQSLTDLPALLLLAVGIAAWERHRTSKSIGFLGLAALAKETSIFGFLGLVIDRRHGAPPLRRRLFIGAAAMLPLAAWSTYVHFRLGSDSGFGEGNFAWPGAGMVAHVAACVRELVAGNPDGRYTLGLIAVFAFLLKATVLIRLRSPEKAWWRVGMVHVVLLPVLGISVWHGYWAAERALLPLTIAYNLLLPAERGFWPLWIAGNLTIIHGIWRFL